MSPAPRAVLSLCAALGTLFLLAGCGAGHYVRVAGASPSAAPDLMEAYGCGACHTIPGVPGADAHVGPSLAGFGDRRTIAGVLPNTPADLVHWLRDPQSVSPGTVMPDLGLGESQARDIAAYLYRH